MRIIHYDGNRTAIYFDSDTTSYLKNSLSRRYTIRVAQRLRIRSFDDSDKTPIRLERYGKTKKSIDGSRQITVKIKCKNYPIRFIRSYNVLLKIPCMVFRNA